MGRPLRILRKCNFFIILISYGICTEIPIIKSSTRIAFSAQTQGRNNKIPILKIVSQFSSGIITERATYRPVGEDSTNLRLDTIIKYMYDPKTRRLQDEQYLLFGRNLFALISYSYTPAGMTNEIVQSNTEGSILRRTAYSWNNQNLLVNEKHYVLNNRLSYILFYQYTPERNLSEEIKYNNQLKTEYTVRYSYNFQGQRTEKKQYDANNLLEYKIIYRYNDDKLIKDYTHFGPDNMLESETTCDYETVAGQRLLVSQTLKDNKGNVKSELLISYDSYGNEIIRAIYNYSGKKKELFQYFETVYEYE